MANVETNPRIRTVGEAFDFVRIPGLMDDLVDIVGSAFRKHSIELFSREGASGGPRWAPLSEKYRKRKKRVRPGRKILVFDGTLRSSLSNASAEGNITDWYRGSKGVFLRFGSSNPVGAYHAPGQYHNPNLPIRDPIQRTDGQIAQYRKLIGQVMTPYVVRAIRDRAALGA